MSTFNCSSQPSNIAFHALVTLALIFHHRNLFNCISKEVMDLIQLFFYTKVIVYKNIRLQPLEKDNDLVRQIQKEYKIELFFYAEVDSE
jgi:hypothetical protein